MLKSYLLSRSIEVINIITNIIYASWSIIISIILLASLRNSLKYKLFLELLIAYRYIILLIRYIIILLIIREL